MIDLVASHAITHSAQLQGHYVPLSSCGPSVESMPDIPRTTTTYKCIRVTTLRSTKPRASWP